MGEAEIGGGAEANGERAPSGDAALRARAPPPSGAAARASSAPGRRGQGRGRTGSAAREASGGERRGAGELWGGRRGHARAPPCCSRRPRPGVWLRARACVPAVRAGRDAEVKFGREGEIRQREEPEWPPLLSPARRRARGKGGGSGLPLPAGGRVTGQREPRGSGFRGVCVGEGAGSAPAARGEPRVEEAAAAGALPRNVAAAATTAAAAVEEATEETGVVR